MLRYPLLETLIATRISLLHALRYKEEREQMGMIRLPFTQSLVDIEATCLVQLSEASRKAGNIQVALNSITRAQQLCSTDRVDVLQEFAHALWYSKEPRAALQSLEKLVSRVSTDSTLTDPSGHGHKARLYALLVCVLLNFSFCDPTDNRAREHGLQRLSFTSPTSSNLDTSRPLSLSRTTYIHNRSGNPRRRELIYSTSMQVSPSVNIMRLQGHPMP